MASDEKSLGNKSVCRQTNLDTILCTITSDTIKSSKFLIYAIFFIIINRPKINCVLVYV